jgi:hypothetical protein
MEETAQHAILMCQYAYEVWREIKSALASDAKSNIWLLSNNGFTITAWHIWEARNAVRASGHIGCLDINWKY